jgi:hypothetical protein
MHNCRYVGIVLSDTFAFCDDKIQKNNPRAIKHMIGVNTTQKNMIVIRC